MPRVPTSGARATRARQAIRSYFAPLFASTGDVAWKHTSEFICGNRAVTEWHRTATLKTGEKQSWLGCDLYTFRRGLIVMKDTYIKVVVAPVRVCPDAHPSRAGAHDAQDSALAGNTCVTIALTSDVREVRHRMKNLLQAGRVLAADLASTILFPRHLSCHRQSLRRRRSRHGAGRGPDRLGALSPPADRQPATAERGPDPGFGHRDPVHARSDLRDAEAQRHLLHRRAW